MALNLMGRYYWLLFGVPAFFLYLLGASRVVWLSCRDLPFGGQGSQTIA
jgi:hypothetical protein